MHTCRFVIIKNHSLHNYIIETFNTFKKNINKNFTNKRDIPALLYINYINCTLITFNMNQNF